MESKGMFQEFLEHRAQLEVIYVASSDETGQVNCVPAIVIDIAEPNKIYYIDFQSSQTHENLKVNNQTSLAFVSGKTFVGFKLTGTSEVLGMGSEYELLNKKLKKKIDSYHAERIIERVTGVISRKPAEMVLPPDYVIVKFTAAETKSAVTKAISNPIKKLAFLQTRIDALEKSESAHVKSIRKLEASRDAFEAQSKAFERKGMEDELTGLLNRRGFVALVTRQFEVTKQKGEQTFLIFLDVDHLKHINDKFGHAMGDEALATTARILNKSFRRSDVIARIGGDEFVVSLSVGSKEDAELGVERLVKNLNEHNQVGENPYTLKLSVGVASSRVNEPEALEELLDQADQIMYAKKRKRKDKPE